MAQGQEEVLQAHHVDGEAAISLKSEDNGDGVNTPSVNSDNSKTEDVVLDWESPDDPENPHNWPLWKKIYHTAIPAFYGFIITMATSAYVPAIPLVMKAFDVSREIAVLPLSLYTFGFVLGPIIAGPLSELYGRRIIYWTSLPLLMTFTAISGASKNITQLVVNRLIAGIVGSGALAVGAGTVADSWSPRANGRAALGFILAPFLGPALGPIAGAYIIAEYDQNWRWSQWVVLIIAAPVLLLAAFMSETSKHRILTLRYQKSLGKETTHQTGDTHLLVVKLRQAIIRPIHMMFLEPLVACLSIYTGFAFGMIFSFFGSYTFVFSSIYHFSARETGLAFLGILVGVLLGALAFIVFDATLYTRATLAAGTKPAPEHRLYAAMLGSTMLPISLFWFAFAPNRDVHWIVPVLAGVPFGVGNTTIFISVTTYLLDVYQAKNGASALAANGILRYTFGAVFPLFTVQMYCAMGVKGAGSVFAGVSCLLMPLPWVFWLWGKRLRERSRYDTFKG
ncbi:hypothetical protein HYALB_00009390 [Hymenoscyphus albidus]|uniref:Major facilitator superfamily (MFS) profile domain-containing protein n=1 Tax=Hymenoscyphus albidus TaxID=595503 RepID=A0A9N9LKB8_9HELO|nr:hypothetical protein HYALB_00009390 [Hymenoscyphus albidus]